MVKHDDGADFSLRQGGLLYAAFRRLGLASGQRSDFGRQTRALVAVGWGPLVLIAFVEWGISGEMPSFFRQVSIHGRLLVAVPLLLLHEFALEHAVRVVLDRMVRKHVAVRPQEVSKLVERAARLRDAWQPEAALLVAALGLSQVAYWYMGGAAGIVENRLHVDAGPLSFWYSLVSLPLFQFLLGRVLWRWMLWVWSLSRLARIEVELIPTHPDRVGGLGFVGLASAAAAPALFALGCVLSSTWIDRIMGDLSLRAHAFVKPAVLFAVLAEFVIVGPLLFFVGQCFRARRLGLRDYGELARDYTRLFRDRWIAGGVQGRPSELLGTSDIQSLADLGHAYEVVEAMSLAPVTRRLVILVLLAALVPMLPLIATERSLWEIMSLLGRELIGGATAP